MRLNGVLRTMLAASLAWPVAARAQDPDAQALLLQAEPLLEPVLQGTLEHAAPNVSVPWSDEASGLSGAIVAAPVTFDGRPCRAVRYTASSGARQVAVEGQRCLGRDGRWTRGRVADAVMLAPVASPLVRDVQAALRRLAYFDGAVDGVASAGLGRAILAFEHDEQAPPEAEPTPGLLELADAAIARIPPAGRCDAEPAPAEGVAVACGSIR